MEDKEEAASILDRIRDAGETLGVSRREISTEMTRLALKKDSAGMKNLFDAYKDWEVNSRRENVSVEQAEELAARNFNVVANYADNVQITGGDDSSALKLADERGQSWAGGKITRFYRDAVGYEPPPADKSSSN